MDEPNEVPGGTRDALTEHSRQKRVRNNVVANYVGRAWTAVMGLAFVPVYLSLLGVEAYGMIGIYALIQSWVVVLDLGMTPTLTREMARFRAGVHTADGIRTLLRTIECLTFGTATLVAIVVFLGSGWLATEWVQLDEMNSETAAAALRMIAAVVGLRFAEGIYRGSLIGLENQVLMNVAESAVATLRGLGAVCVLFWVSATIEAFFVWQILSSLLGFALTCGLTYATLPRASSRIRPDLDSLRGVWRFAAGMLALGVLSLLLVQVDKVLLSTLLSLSEYGVYALSAAAAGALIMLVAPIAQAWFPRLSLMHARQDQSAFASAFHQSSQLASVVMGGAAVFLALFSEPVLLMWTGDAELAAKASILVSALACGNLLNGLMWMPYHAQLATGWTSLSVKVNIVAVSLAVPSILIVTPRFGAVGAATIWTALNACYVLFAAQLMFRRILTEERGRWYLDDLGKPILAALAVAGACRYLVPMPSHRLLLSLVLSMIGVAVVVAAGAAAPWTRSRALALVRARVGRPTD